MSAAKRPAVRGVSDPPEPTPMPAPMPMPTSLPVSMPPSMPVSIHALQSPLAPLQDGRPTEEPQPAPAHAQVYAGRIVIAYLVFGLAWIYGTGWAIRSGLIPAGVADALEFVKGTAFVLATAAVLYVLLARRAHVVRRSQTDLHAALVAHRGTSRLLAAVFAEAALPLYTVDGEGRVTSWNPAAETLYGWTADELMGRVPPIVPARCEREAARMVDLVQSGESIVGFETARLGRDGREVRVSLWIAPLRDDQGAIRGSLHLSQDIGARIDAEEERTRLATAVEQADEGIVITDPKARVVYVNPSFERKSGYGRDELLGVPSRRLRAESQDGSFFDDLWATITRGETWRGYLENRRKDGSTYDVAAVVTPIRDASGSICNYVGVERDVTRERALECQVIEAQRMEAVGQMAGGIAHDFNNLLTAISGYAELLRDAHDDRDPRRADADQVLRAATSAADLVRKLMAFSRRQVLHPENVALDILVAGLQPMLGRLLGESIQLEVAAEPDLSPVRADPGQLEQVLVNLTVNARDAMPDGGTFRVQLADVTVDGDRDDIPEPVRDGRYVRLVASDTGVGLDEVTLARIFEPFFTTKSVGQGTGLGLATVYGIVTQSGGYVFAASKPGSGATFTIYLPCAGAGVTAPRPVVAADPVRGGVETILLVEDEPSVRAFGRAALSRLGYRVLDAADAAEALVLWGREPGRIRLLVTDVSLPGMPGPILAQRLAREDDDLCVLYISGYPEDEMARRGVRVSETGYLAKPFTADSLGRQVRAALDRSGPAAVRRPPAAAADRH